MERKGGYNQPNGFRSRPLTSARDMPHHSLPDTLLSLGHETQPGAPVPSSCLSSLEPSFFLPEGLRRRDHLWPGKAGEAFWISHLGLLATGVRGGRQPLLQQEWTRWMGLILCHCYGESGEP